MFGHPCKQWERSQLGLFLYGCQEVRWDVFLHRFGRWNILVVIMFWVHCGIMRDSCCLLLKLLSVQGKWVSNALDELVLRVALDIRRDSGCQRLKREDQHWSLRSPRLCSKLPPSMITLAAWCRQTLPAVILLDTSGAHYIVHSAVSKTVNFFLFCSVGHFSTMLTAF